MKHLSHLLTVLLVAAFWWQGERLLAANGPTFDEPVHVAAGYSYWATGDFRLNHEDPPLAKLLWTLPQFLFDPIPFRDEWRSDNEWRVGHAMLFDSGHDWRDLLTPARRVNMLFGVGVVVLVGVFARRLTGSNVAGVVASTLATFDPNLVAHSCILSTDVSLTFCTLLTAWRGWEVLKVAPASEPACIQNTGSEAGATRRQQTNILLLGISVGLTLGAKFSAVLVVASVGVGLLAALTAGAVVAMPGAVASPATFGDRVRLSVPVVMRVGLVALLTLLPLYFFVRFPTWGEGLKYQLARGDSGDTSFFLFGEVSARGWLWYFAVALAVKLPVGLLGLAVLGLASGGRQPPVPGLGEPGPQGPWVANPITHGPCGPGSPEANRGLTPPARQASSWFLPVFAVTLFVLISLSKVDLGVRVVLPVVPFVYLLAAGFVARPGVWRKVVAAVAVASVIVSAVRVSPFPLSYFNEFVGGPEQGIRILGDSNLDWGQGLPALREYMRVEGLEVVYLSYGGTAPPRACGVEHLALIGHGQLEPPPLDVVGRGAPEVLVVSASGLQGTYLKDREAYAWLRNREPKAILAGCLWVFDITAEDEPYLRRVRLMP